MKYAPTSAECYSPSSPEVVIFPPKWPKSDTFVLQKTHRQASIDADEALNKRHIYDQNNRPMQMINTRNALKQMNVDVHAAPGKLTTADIISHAKSVLYRPSESEKHGTLTDDKHTPTDISHGIATKEYKSKSSAVLYMLVFLAVILLGFGLVAVVFLIHLSNKYTALAQKLSSVQDSYTHAQDIEMFCLPYEEIAHGSVEEDNLLLKEFHKRQENGEQVYCVKTALHISGLLNLFLKKQVQKKCSEDISNDINTKTDCNNTRLFDKLLPQKQTIQVSAFLQIGFQSVGDNTSQEEQIRNWLSNKPGTHLIGINITDGRLVVPESGIYFTYSQVGYLSRNVDLNNNLASQPLFHRVFRRSPWYPLGNQELLKSTITQSVHKSLPYQRYSSYVGAPLELNKGDQIYVQVSRLQDLARDSDNTYFGLFRIF